MEFLVLIFLIGRWTVSWWSVHLVGGWMVNGRWLAGRQLVFSGSLVGGFKKTRILIDRTQNNSLLIKRFFFAFSLTYKLQQLKMKTIMHLLSNITYIEFQNYSFFFEVHFEAGAPQMQTNYLKYGAYSFDMLSIYSFTKTSINKYFR